MVYCPVFCILSRFWCTVPYFVYCPVFGVLSRIWCTVSFLVYRPVFGVPSRISICDCSLFVYCMYTICSSCLKVVSVLQLNRSFQCSKKNSLIFCLIDGFSKISRIVIYSILINLTNYISVYLSTYLSTYLYTYIPIYLSIYLHINVYVFHCFLKLSHPSYLSFLTNHDK